MKTKLSHIQVTGIATCLPQQKYCIADMKACFGEDIFRIAASTGVEEVRIADPSLCTSDYCVYAAQKLLETMSIHPQSVDGIVFISQTPDYITPATSVIMQDRLGLPKDAVAFDINYGCSGYIYGLFQASLLISSGSCRRVLVCTGDTQVRLVNPLDRANRMVLGDGFAVTLVEQGNEDICFCIKSDGSNYQNLIIPAGGFRMPYSEETKKVRVDEDGNRRSLENAYMNGFEIMSFAIREVPKILQETLEFCQWQKESVGVYAMHQANGFMLEYLAKRAKLPREAVPIALKHVGNTVSASIPMMLSLEYERLRREDRLQRVIVCGFGVGLSWGAATLNLSDTVMHAPWEL